jgi:O-antigen/teichoic acid export membrane protein
MATKFVRNSSYGVLTGVCATFGSFLTSLVVARTLGVEGSGSVAFFIWLVTTSVTIFAAAIPFVIARFIPEMMARGEGEQAAALVARLFKPLVLLIAIPCLAFLTYSVWIYFLGAGERLYTQNPLAYVLVACCCVAQAVGDYARARYRGYQQLDKLASIVILSVGLQILIVAAGSLLFGVPGALCGYLVGSGLPALFLARGLRTNAFVDPELLRRVRRFARFRWASEILAAFVWARIEIVFLQGYVDHASVGLLSVGMTLANLAVQGPLMMTWGLLPKFAEHFGNSQTIAASEAYATSTRFMALVAFPACFGLAALLPELLPILFGAGFTPAIPAAILLTCGAAIPAAAIVGTNVVWAADRSDLDFYSGLIGACIAVAGCMTLIPAFGLMGAVASRVITQISVVAIFTFLMAKKLHIAPPFIDLGKILAAAIVCAVTARLVMVTVNGFIAIPLAVAAGAVVYAIATRLFHALPKADAIKIRAMAASLPKQAEWIVDRALALIAH